MIDSLPPQFMNYVITDSGDKVPVGRDGRNANAHDPANWMSYAEAMANGRVAFVLTKDDPYFFLDLDKCREHNGQWSQQAQAIYMSFAGAMGEMSISGTGLHILGKCDPAQLQHKRNKFDGWLEFYTQERFIAFGDDGWQVIGSQFEPDKDWTGQLLRYVPDRPIMEALPDEIDPTYTGPADDDELIEKMMASVGGIGVAFKGRATIKQLWEADAVLREIFPAYDGNAAHFDHSSADMALMNHLAFWTGRDMPRMERLFRRSALMRPKFEREDYRNNTIQKAAGTCKTVYSANQSLDPNAVGFHGMVSENELSILLFEGGWRDNTRFIYETRTWLFWDGQKWRKEKHIGECTELVRKEIRVLVNKFCTKQTDAKRIGSCQTIKNVVKLMESNDGAGIHIKDVDANPFLVGTPHGVIDLKNGEVCPPEPSEFITMSTSVSPAPKGHIPERWLRFLEEITIGDQDMVSYLQMLAGYALTGSTTEHKMFFAYGSGRNGKSTFLNTLMEIMGEYATQAPGSTFLSKRTDSHPTELAMLQGHRMVRSSEIPFGKSWNDGLIKQITGGDPIAARKMRQDFFQFTPTFKLFIDANNEPSIHGLDEALRRRMVVIPFERTFAVDEVDADLSVRLRDEAPAILMWMIEGAEKWIREGLTEPERVKSATQAYFDAEDVLGEFIEQYYEIDTNGRVPNSHMYLLFTRYLEAEGQKHWSKSLLGKELKRRGYKAFKSGSERGIAGLRPRSQCMPLVTNRPE